MVLTFESVNEILKIDQSNESHCVVFSSGTVYYAVHDNFNFRSKRLIDRGLIYCLLFATIFFFLQIDLCNDENV